MGVLKRIWTDYQQNNLAARSFFLVFFYNTCPFVYSSAPVPLPSTWSRGMRTSLTSWIARRTMGRRSSERGTCSTPSGSRISSWRGWRPTGSGPWCALMNAQGSTRSGEKSSKIYMKSKSVNMKLQLSDLYKKWPVLTKQRWDCWQLLQTRSQVLISLSQ